jgi:hypothetical protein
MPVCASTATAAVDTEGDAVSFVSDDLVQPHNAKLHAITVIEMELNNFIKPPLIFLVMIIIII